MDSEIFPLYVEYTLILLFLGGVTNGQNRMYDNVMTCE